MESSPPRGQHDHSGVRLTRHAIERFVERFHAAPHDAESRLRGVLSRTRRLGRNPENGAIAILALVGERMLVAILQDDTCTTVLTWPQFEPRLAEFGRSRLPCKKGRMLRRLKGDASGSSGE
jgi:hypothetical protein